MGQEENAGAAIASSKETKSWSQKLAMLKSGTFWALFISSLALIISLVDSDIFLTWVNRPQLDYVHFTKERNEELTVWHHIVLNSGRTAAEDIEIQVASFQQDQVSINDIASYDTSQLVKDGIRWTNYKRRYLVPGDSVWIAIESNVNDVKNFNPQKWHPQQLPSLVYFRSKDGVVKISTK